MFTGWPTPLLTEAAVEELRFQARIHGYNTDDLVCTLVDEMGHRRKALLQIKLTLRALPSDQPFSEAITAAWLDFQDDSLFVKEWDRLVLVHGTDADGSMQAAAQLTRFARTSLTGAEFVRKATATGFSSEARRSAFESIKTIIGKVIGAKVDSDALHAFLRHLWFVFHQLASDETQELAELLGRIKLVLGSELGSNPKGVWSELMTTCLRLNGEAASISFANLDVQISGRLAAGFARHRKSDASRLPLEGMVSTDALGVSNARGAFEATMPDIALTASVTAASPLARAAEVGLSVGRFDSANKFISAQLDAINEKLKQFRYEDALSDVHVLGKDIGPFDDHQKARWYLQRGVCLWHLGKTPDAAADFLKSEELFPDDEKMAAARVRGMLLLDDVPGAVAVGKAAMERFPLSIFVWVAYANSRLANGEALSLSDVPPAHRDEADALQMLAWARRQAKDWNGAVELCLKSLECASAGFYTRSSALVTVIENATGNKVLSTYRLVDAPTKVALAKVIAAFDPHADRLWSVQAPETVADTASNLSLAYLLVGDPEGALKVVQEAQAYGVHSAALLRVELEALQQSGQIPQMLSRGRACLAHLAEDGLVALAQAAANAGDVALVEDATKAAQSLERVRPDTVEILHAIRWMAMWNASDRDSVKEEVLAADLATTSSLPLIIAGVRALLKSDADVVVAAAFARGESLVASDPVPENEVLFADLLFEAKEFEKAAPYYEKVVPPGQCSELHNRLLCCYVRTGNRRKAKKLIESFPEGWVDDDGARSLAIELGQYVGDWSLLKVLADAQFRHAPGHVASWLFKHMVAVRSLPVSELRQFLADAPLELEGSIQQISQLAAQEMRYGLREKGMQRMYRVRRLNLSDIESASALLVTFLAIPELLPNMEDSLPAVSAGSSFVAVEQDGQRLQVTIDPADTPALPETNDFKRSGSPDVAPFLGKAPGDEVVLEGGFRSRRVLKIETVSSAYRRLLDLARQDIDRSLKPVPNATSITISTTSEGADFSELHEQLKKLSAHSKAAFQQYQSNPITLGMFGRMVSKSTVEIVRGWPTTRDGPALFVCAGTVDEREAALAQLQDPNAGYVVDAATLTELVMLDSADALKVLPKVFVTTATRDIIKGQLEEAKLEHSSGQAYDEDGRMGFIEFTAEDHARNVRQLQAVADSLERYCEVAPAYGPDDAHPLLGQLEKALSDEEHAVLRLAAEKSLTLLTVDGRLRQWASAAHVPGIWPQVLLMHAANTGQFSPREYSLATMRMFLSSRSFVSMSAQDLLLMCHQGTMWAKQGIGKFKRYLADPATEFDGVFETTMGFIHGVAFSCTYMGAISELLKHVVEGLQRHKDCPPDLLELLHTFLKKLLTGDSPYPYPALKDREKQELLAQLRYLTAALVEGKTWAQQPLQDRPIRLKVLMCGRTPWMTSGDDEDLSRTQAVATVNNADSRNTGSGKGQTQVGLLALDPELSPVAPVRPPADQLAQLETLSSNPALAPSPFTPPKPKPAASAQQ